MSVLSQIWPYSSSSSSASTSAASATVSSSTTSVAASASSSFPSIQISIPNQKSSANTISINQNHSISVSTSAGSNNENYIVNNDSNNSNNNFGSQNTVKNQISQQSKCGNLNNNHVVIKSFEEVIADYITIINEFISNPRNQRNVPCHLLFVEDVCLLQQRSMDYIRKVLKYNVSTYESIESSLIYLNKMVKKPEMFQKTSTKRGIKLGLYQKFVCAVMMATKFNEDNPYNNEAFARLSGVELVLLDEMELDFLLGCNWDVVIKQSEFQQIHQCIQVIVNSR